MAELKPCPFCGDKGAEVGTSSVPSAITGGNKLAVYCNACFCEGPTADTEEQAIERWNARSERVSGRCPDCDGYGGVYTPDGTWIGACHCTIGLPRLDGRCDVWATDAASPNATHGREE